MNFTITSAQILAFCAFLTTLWGVWKIVKEIKKPNDDLKNTVARHDKLLDNDVNSILTKKVSNTEKLTGIIIKILQIGAGIMITIIVKRRITVV